jgi:hypothetical protein
MRESMDISAKYYIECNIEFVLEIEEEKREETIKKINGVLSRFLKKEDVVHLNTNMNLISENNLLMSMAHATSGAEN